MFLFLFKWKGRISGKHTSSGLRGQLMSIVGSVCFVSGYEEHFPLTMPLHPVVKIGTGYLSEKRISGRGGGKGRE